MLKNYIKIALRNLRKHKIDSFISLSGLAVGLTCCILLVMYIQFEWSYDDFHKNRDSIYRLTETSENQNSDELRRSTIHPYAQSVALKEELPEIESVINYSAVVGDILLNGKYLEERISTVSPEFLTTFSFPLISGDPESALDKISSIVLTESAAIKYFGETNVLGQTLTIRLLDEPMDYVVSGVAKDVPLNSSIQFEFLLPFENKFLEETPERRERYKTNWYIGFLETWITLKDGTTPEDLEAQFPAFLIRHYGEKWINRDKNQFSLQPLAEVYFNEEFRSYYTQSTNKTYSLILGGIAIVILVIAGINFMSLTLSRASSRFHEIGIRKTVGAIKHQIKFQIIGEVFITCFLAICLGLVLAEAFSPYVGVIFGKELNLSLFSDLRLWLAVAGLLVLLTLITSMYPAFQISRKSAVSLFSRNTTAQKIPAFVKGLIVIQFCLATSLMIGTFVMQQQLSLILNKDIGFNPENVAAIEFNSELQDGLFAGKLFADEATKIPGVISASITGGEYRDYSSYGVPTMGMAQMMSSTTHSELGDGISSEAIDEHYLETMGIKLVEGSNFSTTSNTYSPDEMIINQAFADAMKWDNPVGQILVDRPENQGWTGPFDGKKVIGVVENFNFKSLYDPLQPMALRHIEAVDRNPGTILVKISSSQMPETISKLEELWNKIYTEEVFTFSFLDDLIQYQYNEEIRWNKIIRISSIASILLACFGLFGLAALTAQKRVKEIGIRKVFGASVASIVTLLSKDFVKLVILGFVVAIPIAWYASGKWLEAFAYKIELGPGIFVIAGMVALAIALSTISWQAIRSASANPVDSLRSE